MDLDNDHIRTSECDDCRARAPGTLLHCRGTPVLFLCKRCDPRSFEMIARENIRLYLAGGTSVGMAGYEGFYMREAS